MSSSETCLPDRRASASAFRRVARSPASWRARRSFSTDADVLAGLGHAVEAEHLDRLARQRLRRRGWPRKSCIARTRPQCAPATSESPTSSVPRPIRIVTTGPRPGSSFDSITVPDAGASGLARELLDLGHHQDRLEQVVEPLLGLGRDVDELSLATPLDRLQPELGHLGADAVGLRALLVDLVDRDEHRHARPPWRGRPPPGSAASRRRRRRPRSRRCRSPWRRGRASR